MHEYERAPVPPFHQKPVPKQNYKFQRLREAIRQAILDGEFRGRLPGERALGRRYEANAKTVNKALSDLCRDGLLYRHMGRGTFIAEDGNGAASPRRPLAIGLLGPSTLGDPGRRTMLDAISQRLAAGGHTLTNVGGPGIDRREIPLSAWSATSRRRLGGLVNIPRDVLSAGVGRLSPDCLEHAMRRQIPVVSIGACGTTSRISAVLPDYVDAGFRLAEHAYQTGCTELAVVTAAGAGREVEFILQGCRTSTLRRGWILSRVVRSRADGESDSSDFADLYNRLRSSDADGGCVGVISVGAPATRAVFADAMVSAARSRGLVCLAAVCEAGDTTGAALGLTSYETSADRLADWACRLLASSRPAARPVEVLVPGSLVTRLSRGSGATDGVCTATPRDREPAGSVPAEVAI